MDEVNSQRIVRARWESFANDLSTADAKAHASTHMAGEFNELIAQTRIRLPQTEGFLPRQIGLHSEFAELGLSTVKLVEIRALALQVLRTIDAAYPKSRTSP